MTDIEDLKESQRRLEAKLKDLIERSPALRKAMEREHIERLKARSEELLVKTLALQKMTKKKSEFLFLPGGIHSIAPVGCGQLEVLVDEQTAIEFEAQRRIILARRKLPYLGFDHDDNGPASFYPTCFFWREGERTGVFVRGIWSKEGEHVWKSGEFKAFSPCFIVNKTATPPYTISCSVTADANMGGLTNNPAFGEKLRLAVTESIET